jgi:heterotetrameric sarcosine oxidase gamma subunit
VSAWTPIRRSALEARHAALGASWISDSVRWPAAYGDPDLDRAVVATAAGIAEIGPLDIHVVRGAGAADGQAGSGDEAWVLAPDEVLVFGGLPKLERALTVIDVSSGWTALRISGPATSAILEEACPVDLSEPGIVQAPIANVRVTVRVTDASSARTLLVARDEAQYLWDALLGIGERHGLRPVGPGAVMIAPAPELDAVR